MKLEWGFLCKLQCFAPKMKFLQYALYNSLVARLSFFQVIINKGEIYTNKAKGDDELPFNLLHKRTSVILYALSQTLEVALNLDSA